MTSYHPFMEEDGVDGWVSVRLQLYHIMTPVLTLLPWLPVKFRIELKSLTHISVSC